MIGGAVPTGGGMAGVVGGYLPCRFAVGLTLMAERERISVFCSHRVRYAHHHKPHLSRIRRAFGRNFASDAHGDSTDAYARQFTSVLSTHVDAEEGEATPVVDDTFSVDKFSYRLANLSPTSNV